MSSLHPHHSLPVSHGLLVLLILLVPTGVRRGRGSHWTTWSVTFPHSQLSPALVGSDVVWIKLHSLCAVMDSFFELAQLQGDKHIE